MPKRKHQEAQMNAEGDGQGTSNNRRTRLPSRWLYCPPMGRIVVNKFLPMKTPLDETYDHLIESKKYLFHPEDVFQINLSDSSPGAKIGLWIDLTNSDNFYRPDEIRKHACRYVKMKMVGHGESPTVEQTNAFIKLVDDFSEKNSNKIIVVHCTHGFNRTGFLICAYLYDRVGLSIEMAVREFAEHRPTGIYKQGYLNDLRQRYGDEDEQLKLESPGKPLWEDGPVTDEEFANGIFRLEIHQEIKNGYSHTSTSDTSQSTSSTSNVTTNAPLFMDGKVPGVRFVDNPELRRTVQEKARNYCGYGSKGFPGSQPVSLEGPHGNNNINFLANEPYMVSWKADGVRYLVLIDGKNNVFAFDRDNNPFLIEKMAFIRRQKVSIPAQQPISDDEFLHETLVDAEMVIDQLKVGTEVQEIPRLLIYDLIAFQGHDMRNKDFSFRFDMIEKELIRPRTEAFKLGRLRREEEPIGVRRKDFWAIEATHKILKPGFLSCHEVDGLIFQPIKRPYTSGRFDHLLKWKPPELSSIDFRLEIKKVHRTGELPEYRGELHVLHSDKPFAIIKANKQLLRYNNKIIECKFQREKGTWEFMRERTDKSHPNAFSTASSVWNTIQYPIYKHDLLNFIQNLFRNVSH